MAILPFRHTSRSRAEVIISEIMYDPQNADTNREWVELFNTGTSAVSLSGWQFGLPSNNLWTCRFPASAIHRRRSSFGAHAEHRNARFRLGRRASIAFKWATFPSLTNDPNGNADCRDGRYSQQRSSVFKIS